MTLPSLKSSATSLSASSFIKNGLNLSHHLKSHANKQLKEVKAEIQATKKSVV